jgi:YVTN family beta-propeller protein
MRRRTRWFIPLAIVLVTALTGIAAAQPAASDGQHGTSDAHGGFGQRSGLFGEAQVGPQANGAVVLPTDQQVTPAGTRISVAGRLVSSALRPDGITATAETWTGDGFTAYLSVVNLASGAVVQQLNINRDYFAFYSTVGEDGPTYSSDGNTLWVPQDFDLLKFSVAADGTLSNQVVIPAQTATGAPWLPSHIVLSPDGTKAYVVLNGLNALGILDTATSQFTAEIPVGNAPRQVVLNGDKAYVSNEGGRPAHAGDSTNLSNGTPIVSDPSTGAATTGTVSVVDLIQGKELAEIPVGLHPGALFRAGKSILVANADDDTVSVIDTTADNVVQTFSVNPLPFTTVSGHPNAITMPDADHVLVSLGNDNAIAVLRWPGPHGHVYLQGLIPTDWYPVNVQMDTALHKLVVTSDKGIGARGALLTEIEGPGIDPATGFSDYHDLGTMNVLALPSTEKLARYTAQVFDNNRWTTLYARNLPGSRYAKPVAIPDGIGSPSLIKHVFVIIKENRPYDQILGDLPQGNGDPALTQYGQSVTPNQHKLATSFSLLDNFYTSGTLSPDGHNWLMEANSTDYLEREFGPDFYRSYPYAGGDSLVYPKTGFLWNAADRAGRTVANWGEFQNSLSGPFAQFGTWTDWYNDSLILEGKKPGSLHVPVGAFTTSSDIPSLNAITHHDFPNFTTSIPDQYRADMFLKDFQQYKQHGNLPNLNVMYMGDDHTTGGAHGYPTVKASVADNDLATGRVIDAIAHSQYWKDSAVFVVEDESQSAVDHVDGHRSIVFVASPYARRGAVNHTYYTQLDLVRTVEQILGITPMSQMDLAAVPMRDVFTNSPNFTPFNFMPNQVPLDQMNP